MRHLLRHPLRAPLRAVLPALLLLTIAACASEQRYRDETFAWVGRSTKELVKTWGKPHAAFTMQGNTVLVYDRLKPGAQLAGLPPGSSERCTTYFEVDKDKVVAVGFKGDDCRK